jgi:hypothetical protein
LILVHIVRFMSRCQPYAIDLFWIFFLICENNENVFADFLGQRQEINLMLIFQIGMFR